MTISLFFTCCLETSSSNAAKTTPCKDLIVSALCVVAGMESKTAPPAQSTVNPNTSQPNSPSKHIADIDSVAPPCLVAGISLSCPKDIHPTTSEPTDVGSKNIEMEELAPVSAGDDAGLGVDISNRKPVYSDSYFGDTVDSISNSPVDEVPIHQRHCLLVYRTAPKVKETASSKTVTKTKGNLYKTSGMYSLPTLAMSEILEMEEEQQALVDEPMSLEDLTQESVTTNTSAGDPSLSGSNSKTSSIANEKAIQCVDLPALVQRDDLWISSIVPCLDRQHILVVVGPHEGHLQNSGTASNIRNKCNTVQNESRNNISQQNDLNKGSAFEDNDEDDEGKPEDSTPVNPSLSKPFAKFFGENMPNEEASSGPTVEDIAIGDSECIKPFAKFFSENPGLAPNSSGSSSDYVPQDPSDGAGGISHSFAKLFIENKEDLGSSGKTDSRFFPKKKQQQDNNGSGSSGEKPFAKYFSSDGTEKDKPSSGGYVLVYKLQCVNAMVAIVEEPVYIHSMGDTCKSFTKVVPLPTEICDSGSDEEIDVKPDVIPQQPETLLGGLFDETDSKGSREHALGKFAALTDQGKVIIFDAATFNIFTTIVPSNLQSPKLVDRTSPNDKFITMMYCSGMERLCVCSSSGQITFLQLLTREMNRIKRSKRIDKISADLETDSAEDTDAVISETGE